MGNVDSHWEWRQLRRQQLNSSVARHSCKAHLPHWHIKGTVKGTEELRQPQLDTAPRAPVPPCPAPVGGSNVPTVTLWSRSNLDTFFNFFTHANFFTRRDLPKRPRPACNRALMFKEPRERRAAVKRRSRPSSRRQARLSDETASVLQTVGRDFQFHTFRHISRPRPINIHFYIFVIRHRHL